MLWPRVISVIYNTDRFSHILGTNVNLINNVLWAFHKTDFTNLKGPASEGYSSKHLNRLLSDVISRYNILKTCALGDMRLIPNYINSSHLRKQE